jgi:hypothetical protein
MSASMRVLGEMGARDMAGGALMMALLGADMLAVVDVVIEE